MKKNRTKGRSQHPVALLWELVASADRDEGKGKVKQDGISSKSLSQGTAIL